MYKIVVFWRWDKGKLSADCFWCVPWPQMSIEEFDAECSMRMATHTLQNGPDAPYLDSDVDTLIEMGLPDAARMLRDLPKAHLRARFNQMEMEIFDSDCPLTREQVEEIKRTRREP